MPHDEAAQLISAHLEDRSAKGIAAAVAKQIVDGALNPGMRLPPTRVLASSLKVSAGSISDAWKLLAADGLLETRGRQGTFVVDPDVSSPWRPFRGVVGAEVTLDLSTGFPDPEMLIDLRPYLQRLTEEPPYTGYPRHQIDPELAEALTPLLPQPPTQDNTLVATHILGALDQLLPAVGAPFSRVIVGDPEFAPYLDLLERFRFAPVPIPMDHDGMMLEPLRAALAQGASAVILQPRLHNPSGIVTSKSRLQAIAELCAEHDTWILEGDYYGEILPVERYTASTWAPDHTLYMTAFSKNIHPDIRVAILNGPSRLVRGAHRRRVGGFEVSRINQDLLRLILQDQDYRTQIRTAREEYWRRQDTFVKTLSEHGISIEGNGGFNVWVPVRSEADALVYLASKGIGVAPGSAFQVSSSSPHLRVSTASITGNVEAIAREIAIAATTERSKS